MEDKHKAEKKIKKTARIFYGITIILFLIIMGIILFMAITPDKKKHAKAETVSNEDANENADKLPDDSGIVYDGNSALHDTVRYTNTDTAYKVVIKDDANLLTDEEETNLVYRMKDITDYGNVAFITVGSNPYSTKDYINSEYSTLFGNSSGNIFMIDMDNRNVWIVSGGFIYGKITISQANMITDKFYRLASEGKYYECASAVFETEYKIITGHKIFSGMKIISNALLAILLAFLINFIVAKKTSTDKEADNKELLMGTHFSFDFSNINHMFLRRETHKKSSSGGHGGHGGGRGGGGHGF